MSILRNCSLVGVLSVLGVLWGCEQAPVEPYLVKPLKTTADDDSAEPAGQIGSPAIPDDPAGGAAGGGGRGGGDPEERFRQMDADGDGKLTGDEIPERMRQFLERIDEDKDGSISKEEMAAARERRGQRGGDAGGPGGGGPGGGGPGGEPRPDRPQRPESGE